MSVSYDNLWVLLSQKGLRRKDLCSMAGITTNVLAKLGRNESVQIEALSKICDALQCSLNDIISYTSEDPIIFPFPNIDFSDEDVFDYSIGKEYETLKIKTLKDLPKPHTVKNIQQTLTDYIETCKLSYDAVYALLIELNKHNILINNDPNTTPKYEAIPKYFSNDDCESDIYNMEYQQAENYINWILSNQNLEQSLNITSTDLEDTFSGYSTFNSLVSLKVICADKRIIQYSTAIDTVTQQSQYPFNLLCSLFGYGDDHNNDDHYYFKYQRKNIEIAIENALSTLPSKDKTMIYAIYKNNLSQEDVLRSLNIPEDNPLIKEIFIRKFIARPLMKLRHPSRSRSLKNSTFTTYNLNIDLDKLEWYFEDLLLDNHFKKAILELTGADYVTNIYHSNLTELKTTIVIAEVLHENALYWHMFSIDTFNNIIEIEEIESIEDFIKPIIDQYKNHSLYRVYDLQTSIEKFDFSVRTFNCLKRAQINTFYDIITKTLDDLTKIRNLGQNSLDEIIHKLHKYGYHLNNDGIFECWKHQNL